MKYVSIQTHNNNRYRPYTMFSVIIAYHALTNFSLPTALATHTHSICINGLRCEVDIFIQLFRREFFFVQFGCRAACLKVANKMQSPS